MKFKYIVCTFILVVISIGAVSAADDLSPENVTAGELAVDSAGEVKLVDEKTVDNDKCVEKIRYHVSYGKTVTKLTAKVKNRETFSFFFYFFLNYQSTIKTCLFVNLGNSRITFSFL